METKYTPGPWHKELGGFVYSDHSKVADAGFAKKECERSANARLIAASPEMIEELIKILQKPSHRGTVVLEVEDICSIRSVVNKAIGD